MSQRAIFRKISIYRDSRQPFYKSFDQSWRYQGVNRITDRIAKQYWNARITADKVIGGEKH